MNQSPPIPSHDQIIKTPWRDQAIWSEVANQLKADLFGWRYRAAVAGVLGAFLVTLAASLTGLNASWWWLPALIAALGAVVLATVPYILRTRVSKEQVQNWVRARSASEGLKDTIYRYLLGASPFGPTSSAADLIDRCEHLKKKVADLNIHAATIVPPQREYPLALTVEEYIENRVNDQINEYYRPKGREKALAARKLHNLEFVLGLFAVIMGALASVAAATRLAYFSVLGPWVAVVTTASGAVSAHLAASRYDHEAIIYFGTADRLESLRNRWLGNPKRMDAGCIREFVDSCEHAISTENEAWLSKWTRDPSDERTEPVA